MMVAKDLPVEKNYKSWLDLKEKLDARAKDKLPSFKQREVWWTHIGVNVGSEILGKDGGFWRPILIIKRYQGSMFLAAPWTSTPPKLGYKNHVSVNFKKRQSTVLLDQIRTLDARRLVRLMGNLDEEQFEKVMVVLKRGF